MNRAHVKTSIQALAWYCTGWLLKKFKLSFIFGSKAMFFSVNQCVAPVFGRHMRTHTLIAVCLVQALVTSIFSSLSFIVALIVSCPFSTVCAAIYLRSIVEQNYGYVRACLATTLVACFTLFIVHPVGCYAWSYTLFWLLPLSYLFLKKRCLFLTALSSTFMAHAIGSVLSLYFMQPLTAEQWIGLMPIVLIERILFASGIVICVYVSDLLMHADTHRQLLRYWYDRVYSPSVQ